jgi:uncharacterized protein (TIGR02145 family)
MPGTFVDYRDDRTYKKITVVGKMWMAENLNYETSSGSWCYRNETSNCAMYGRLYDWTTAMMACPVGWHLPTREEWGDLAIAAGGTGTYGTGGTAGKALKSTTGWNGRYESGGGGTDRYGFNALPGGGRGSDGGFGSGGYSGFWWTATEDGARALNAYDRGMFYDYDDVHSGNPSKSIARSVRCVGD